MTPDDVTAAIVQAILNGGEQWIVSTVAALLPALWAMTVILHLARPYILRTIKKLSLRFGADVWWLGYVLVRDAVMLITFVLSLIFLFPNLVMTIPLPLTAPLAGCRAYRVATALLGVGAAFYLIPQIFAIETASQERLSGVANFLTSTSNTALMGPILIVSMLGYGLIGGLIFQQVAVRGRRFGQKSEVGEAAKAA